MAVQKVTGRVTILGLCLLAAACLAGCPSDEKSDNGAAGASAAGTGAGTGVDNSMAGNSAADTCVPDVVAGGNTQACAECLCTKCGDKLGQCTLDATPSPNPTVQQTSGEVCQEILACSKTNACMGDPCWCGCTSADGCCATEYAKSGPCKEVINKGASMASSIEGLSPYYPSEADETEGPGHPIGNSTAVGVCQKTQCAAECM